MKLSMSSMVVSSLQRGWSMPSLSTIEENLLRSSARSMSMAEVPSMLMPLSIRGRARLFGIWPPTLTMTPYGCSSLHTSITVSKLSSSK